MPPSETGLEIALQAIQGTLEGYKETVEQGFRDMRNDLKDHEREETRWQERIETEVLKLTALPAKVEALSTKVEKHEEFVMQGKGAIVASKAIWALLGVAAAFVVWVSLNVFGVRFQATSVAAAPPPERDYPAHHPTMASPPPAPPSSAASSARP